jgi:hypothetical protein
MTGQNFVVSINVHENDVILYILCCMHQTPSCRSIKLFLLVLKTSRKIHSSPRIWLLSFPVLWHVDLFGR